MKFPDDLVGTPRSYGPMVAEQKLFLFDRILLRGVPPFVFRQALSCGCYKY